MSLNTEYIENLVFKFNNGSITPKELQVLTDWYNSHDDQKAVVTSPPEKVKSRMLTSLLARVANKRSKSVKLYPKLRWLAAAASIIVIAFGAVMVIKYKSSLPHSAQVKTSIEPGGNKATLTLPDGKSISLSNAQTGIVAGAEIRYIDGSIIENTNVNQTNNTQQLTLHTPRGGTYIIRLQDGTQVWLNAESTLKYPSGFSAEERVVELDGEAYFAVKPAYNINGGKIPFKVTTGQQIVEVLGTEFNISTYPDQASSKTTLIAGKVALSNNDSRIILSPNEQAVTTNGKTIVKKVEVTNYTAWRDGKFSFDGKTFKETMAEIGRWYDLDIIYENGVPSEELVGDAFRNQNIGFVLRLLDVAEINYKLDVNRRKLTIKGKKK
ncbi:FecR family protein [Pedobacter frigoris]|uniref:DUF4974 domain-containing protein n=1 Tax=Pedobacter frigoris TaxID=2571272 RepID=A0A4U1CHD6_9SPHI|nr:FecR family protein [Pedobacter frigoris]TKC06184.1 DUF4974 domain-containing protein [Pedobacter frigoris]